MTAREKRRVVRETLAEVRRQGRIDGRLWKPAIVEVDRWLKSVERAVMRPPTPGRGEP